MSDLADFNDMDHRVTSASACFQKGIYYLFLLSRKKASKEFFSLIITIYQCLFQFCACLILLDPNFDMNKDKRGILRRLKDLCEDPNNPKRSEIDPAATITHSIIEKEWRGFTEDHDLYDVSKKALNLYKRVNEARHNLIYRPFMLADNFWEDCTLIDLIKGKPEYHELEELFVQFSNAVFKYSKKKDNDYVIGRFFLQSIFTPYKDKRGLRPTETILLTYARLLNPDNQKLLEDLRIFRNRINNVVRLKRAKRLTFLESWKIGEM